LQVKIAKYVQEILQFSLVDVRIKSGKNPLLLESLSSLGIPGEFGFSKTVAEVRPVRHTLEKGIKSGPRMLGRPSTEKNFCPTGFSTSAHWQNSGLHHRTV
jgi:hypothetical protein